MIYLFITAVIIVTLLSLGIYFLKPYSYTEYQNSLEESTIKEEVIEHDTTTDLTIEESENTFTITKYEVLHIPTDEIVLAVNNQLAIAKFINVTQGTISRVISSKNSIYGDYKIIQNY